MENNKKELPMKVGLKFETIPTVKQPPGFVLKLYYKDKVVASCSLITEKNKQFYVFGLNVEEEFQSGNPKNKKPEEFFGFGSQLIEFVNSFLESHHSVGRLVNGITEIKKKKMYENHGWEFNKDDSSMYYFPKLKIKP